MHYRGNGDPLNRFRNPDRIYELIEAEIEACDKLRNAMLLPDQAKVPEAARELLQARKEVTTLVMRYTIGRADSQQAISG